MECLKSILRFCDPITFIVYLWVMDHFKIKAESEWTIRIGRVLLALIVIRVMKIIKPVIVWLLIL